MVNTELIDSYRYILLKQIHSVDIGAEMMLFISTQFSNLVQKLNPSHLFAQMDCVWNTRQHGTKANWSLFKSEKPSYRLSFYLSRAYRDPTVQTTQYNGLCHVTNLHTAVDTPAEVA